MPGEISWTKSQKAAIEARQRNILVSAAAGSGKTAVLVERIIRRVMVDDDNTDIDRMLVVTFTKAAASEMKEKINKRLRKYKAKTIYEKKRLRNQINSLDDADICTIDAFCINCVRNFAQELGITQDFRMCDPAEDAVIIEDAIGSLIRDYYKSGDEEFLKLTNYYSNINNDDRLKELIIKLYGFIQSYAEPMDKLMELFRFYNESENIIDSLWLHKTIELQRNENKAFINTLINDDENSELYNVILNTKADNKAAAAELCKLCGKDEKEKVTPATEKGLIYMIKIIRSFTYNTEYKSAVDEWSALYKTEQAAEALKAEKPSKPRGKKEWVVKAGNVYETFKNAFDLRNKYIVQSFDEMSMQHKEMCRIAAIVQRVIKELSERISKIKNRKNSYSFSDIEHFAYKLISENDEAAQLYRSKYTDILIDEYQDTNGLQDAILTGISRGNNIFMVGDLKQSIYAFRGGDPTIFKKKGSEYVKYSEDSQGTEPARIDLANNFRSNSSVVNAVNELFGFVMSDAVGDVDYIKEGEYLVCGRSGGDSDEMKKIYADEKSEIIAIPFKKQNDEINLENGNEIDSITIEARYVAQRIRRMVDNHIQICAGDKIRNVEYGDFTIIASSIKDIINIYKEALDKEGIPLGVPMLGYYDFFEVSVVLSFLRVLINRRADAALITVMRSPIGLFSDDELAYIGRLVPEIPVYDYEDTSDTADETVKKLLKDARLMSRAPFYERMLWLVKNGRKIGISPALIIKVKRFIQLIEHFEGYKHYKNAANIIYDIYTETGFYNFVGAMEGGIQAQQNLTLFYERAKRFTETGANGLYSFVRYIEKLREGADNETGAAAAGESRNMVRMMTIHGSKGLEFPVVFVVSCGKDFRRVEGGDMIINRDTGIGLKYISPDEKKKISSPLYNYVQNSIKRESRSEDMRKLYVALTRAREKLICVMALKNVEADKYQDDAQLVYNDTIARKKALLIGEHTEPQKKLEDAKGFFEWLLCAYYAGKDNQAVIPSAVDGWYLNDKLKAEDYFSKDIYSILENEYNYQKLVHLPSKTTVSKVKEESRRQEKESNAVFEPVYITDIEPLQSKAELKKDTESVSASVIGIAYHKVLELADPKMCADVSYAAEQIKHLAQKGEFSADAAKYILPERISGFFGDDIMGKRIIAAYEKNLLHRESDFEIAIAPDVYDNSLTTKDYTENDKMLLQGTIDCWFEEDDGNGGFNCIIIDYKTDKKHSETDEEFAIKKSEEYRVQLQLYGEAINKLEGKRVTEMYLYLFATGNFVKVKNGGV